MRTLIITIPHSGTHYLADLCKLMYPGEIITTHCYKPKQILSDYDAVLTTWRDPLRVAASWFNRYRDNDASWHYKWFRSWGAYKKLLLNPKVKVFTANKMNINRDKTLEGASENQSVDKYKLHAALDNNNMGYYYSLIDPKYITGIGAI